MGSQIKRGVVGTLLFAVAGYVVWWVWAGAQPDPKFGIDNLRGLTPDQVIQRLGPPTSDPRRPEFGGWTPSLEPKDGPLVFIYDENRGWAGWGHGIVFDNGKVSKVVDGHK
jgi:hypothetical protein